MAVCPKCNKTVGVFVVVPVEVEIPLLMDYRNCEKWKYEICVHSSDIAECSRCGYKDNIKRFYT